MATRRIALGESPPPFCYGRSVPRRPARPATGAYLERVALHYLERYPGSVARVRRALERRVRRSIEELGTDREEGFAALEAVLGKLVRMGYLDDERFARARALTLRARGRSARAIRATLQRQGIDGALADTVLGALGDAREADLEAARALVRKRRLGAHRLETPEGREERAALRQKDLAKLARAGFGYEIARRALDEE